MKLQKYTYPLVNDADVDAAEETKESKDKTSSLRNHMQLNAAHDAEGKYADREGNQPRQNHNKCMSGIGKVVIVLAIVIDRRNQLLSKRGHGVAFRLRHIHGKVSVPVVSAKTTGQRCRPWIVRWRANRPDEILLRVRERDLVLRNSRAIVAESGNGHEAVRVIRRDLVQIDSL
jgi:hypothetical protein